MSRAGDDPLLEIHVTGDWSEFDRQAQQREQQLAGRDFTFAAEGKQPKGFLEASGFFPGGLRSSLPPPAQPSFQPIQSGFMAASGFFPGMQQAAEQISQAFVRLIPNVVQRMTQQALPGPNTKFSDTSFWHINGPGEGPVPHSKFLGGRVWRGMQLTLDQINDISRGGYIPQAIGEGDEASLATSFTTNMRHAADYARYAQHRTPLPGSVPVMFHGFTTRGEHIAMDPLDPQHEVLIEHGTPFRVKRQYQKGRVRHFEIEDPRALPGPGAYSQSPSIIEGEQLMLPAPTISGLPHVGYNPGTGWVGGGLGGGAGGGGGGLPAPYTGGGGGMPPIIIPGMGGGGGGGAGGGFGRRMGRGFGHAMSGISGRMYMTTMFALWDVHRTTEALRHMETQVAGAQTVEEVLGTIAQGHRQASSGLLSGIVAMGLDLTGSGPTQVLDLLESERLRYSAGTRVRGHIIGTRQTQDIMAATLLGTGTVARVQGQQQLENENLKLRDRQAAIQMILSRKDTETLFGRLLTGHAEDVNAMWKQDVWSRQVNALQDEGQRNVLRNEFQSITREMASNQAKTDFDETERVKDRNMQRRVIQGQADTFRSQLPGTTRQQAELNALVTRQRLELEKVARFTPELVTDTVTAQVAEKAVLIYQQDLHEHVRDIESGSAIDAALARGGRQFYAAQRIGIIGQARAAWRAAERDPREQARITNQANIDLYELFLNESFNRQQQMTSVTGATRVAQLVSAHMPLQAAQERLRTEATNALAAVPKDNPRLYAALQQQFRQQSQGIDQQYRENLFMRNLAGATQEEYLNQLSTAYGPGARQRRLQAEVFRMTREAETRATGRQLEDVTDVEGRDRERRIGVSRLKAFQAQYIEGLQAQEGSLFRTNLQNTATGNPTEVLQTIAQGITELTRRIGTLVAIP